MAPIIKENCIKMGKFLEKEISSIVDAIEKRDIAFFVGAGISKNSGLPLANELRECILEKMSVNNREFLGPQGQPNSPFEAFIETISKDLDISRILDIFEDGKLNINQILIAKLAKNGYLKVILTTNFDLLIETALENEGLKRDKDFKVYCNEEQFSKVDFKDIENKIIRIFKIHGSIDDRNSVRTTMKAVASKTLSDKRMKVIRYLFSTGNHKKVLILGYSCFDVFDIIPQIQSIEENQKEIIFVDHYPNMAEESMVEDIKTQFFRNPFKEFSGKRIRCDTEKLIEALWGSLKETGAIEEEYKFTKPETIWRKYIDDWDIGLEKNKEYLKYFIPAYLALSGILYSNRTIEYFEKSLNIAKETSNKKKEAICYICLGNAYLNIPSAPASSIDLARAIEYFEKALEISKEIRDKKREADCYLGLGSAYNWLKSFTHDGIKYYEIKKKVIEYYKKYFKIARKIEGKAGEAEYYIYLGDTYRASDKKKIKYVGKALKIAKEIGDKKKEIKCYRVLGGIYRGLNIKKAVENYKKALKVYEEIGSKSESWSLTASLKKDAAFSGYF